MNPLLNLLKQTQPSQDTQRYRQKSKNLQLNMSLVEEEANEMNDTINKTQVDTQQSEDSRAPTSPVQVRKGTLQELSRKSTLNQLRKRQSQNKEDFLISRGNTRHLLILQADESDEEQEKKESHATSERSSDDESSKVTSPRSSDLSSEQEQPVGNSQQVRFSEETAQISARHFSKKQSTLNIFRPLAYSFYASVKAPTLPLQQPYRYFEEIEFGKRTTAKSSILQTLFKKKSQGYIIYHVELVEEHANNMVRSRNNTSMRKRNSFTPQSPSSVIRRRVFSPMMSPSANKAITFPDKQLINTEVLQRAQQRIRMLKLLPQELEEILTSSSESEEDEEKQKLRHVKEQLEMALVQKEQITRELNKAQPDASPRDVIEGETSFKNRLAQGHVERDMKSSLHKPKINLNQVMNEIEHEIDDDPFKHRRPNPLQRRPLLEMPRETLLQRIRRHTLQELQNLSEKLKPWLDQQDKSQHTLANINPIYLVLGGLGFLLVVFVVALVMVQIKHDLI